MEIVVAVKPVPDAETRLRPAPDGTRLDPAGVKWVLGGYDESAVEQALLLREAGAATAVRAVTVGPAPRGEEVLRSAIALGCDRATWVETPADAALDGIGIARLLGFAIAKVPHDLVLVGKHAGDDESGIVGPALAELLGIPSFPAVVDLRPEAAARGFRFQEALDGGTVRVEAAPPLLVALQQAWNDPRTAKLPNILKSRKATIDRVAWNEASAAVGPTPGGLARPTRFRLPPPRTGARMIPYKTPEEAATALVRALRDEAKVFP